MKKSKHDRRAYHRVADSVLHEPWDNDLFAYIGRLQAALHERWRTCFLEGEEAGVIRLCHSDLLKITGKGRLDVALTLARRGADVTSTSVRRDGDEIKWLKWPEFQGLIRESAGVSSASASSVQRPRPEEEKKNKTARKKRAAVSCPESLGVAEWAAVEAWTALNHPALTSSLPAIWQEVRAWAESRDMKRPGWAATLRTFVMRRAKEPNDGPQRIGASNGRRLTAVEAGQRILDRFGPPREDAHVRETIHVVPVRGQPG